MTRQGICTGDRGTRSDFKIRSGMMTPGAGAGESGPLERTLAVKSGTIPVTISDPINSRILAVSEDKLQGFQRDPLGEIARQSGVELPVVQERIQGMLRAGTIRRIRQTLMATNLAQGALVAWRVPPDRLDAAFDYMFERDPFTGHVVIRSTDSATAGSQYRLWTTLKVPQGYSVQKHSEFLQRETGAEHFRLMPAKRLFALGVGHVRRRGMIIGSKADVPAEVMDTEVVELNELEWRVLLALKREFEPEEICETLWQARADEAGVPLDTLYAVAEALNRRRVIGRFSTFLEHVKPLADGERVTRYNALFHWAVMPGREIEAGREIGRHHILTHCYWREGGPEFRNVNIMAVAHGMDREVVLQHKAAIDEHLKHIGIPVSYTNVFWGGRSSIKPSEISPFAYREWCLGVGLDPEKTKE
ncbi:MAG: Lrp/AsnC family transcriptional regulator [Candidatus Methylomirabilales bacterium]